MFTGFVFDFVQPSLNHFVGVVACSIETLPQSMVWQATLISFFPFFTQLTQSVLHFSTAYGGLKVKLFLTNFRLDRFLGILF